MATITLDQLQEELNHAVAKTLQGCEAIGVRIQENIRADLTFSLHHSTWRETTANLPAARIWLDDSFADNLRCAASLDGGQLMTNTDNEGHSPCPSVCKQTSAPQDKATEDFNDVGLRFHIRQRNSHSKAPAGFDFLNSNINSGQELEDEMQRAAFESEDGTASLRTCSTMSDDVEPMQFKACYVVREELGPSLEDTMQNPALSSTQSKRGKIAEKGRQCSRAIHNLVNGGSLDYLSTVLIILNAAQLGVQTDYMATKPGRDEDMFFKLIEEVFWLVALFTGVSTEGSQMKSFSIMRVLRVLRLVRVLRLIRIMHLISELRTIIVAIAGSMRSLAWTLALLLVLVYIIGVFFTQLVSDHFAATINKELTDEGEQLQYYFGRLGRSLLTLYMMISGGTDWNDVLHPLMVEISWALVFLVVGYIAFVVFALMNVVTGVFVESALSTAKKDQEVLLLHQMRHFLDEIDSDGSGTISWNEFEGHLDNPTMQQLFKAMELDPDEAQDLFRLIDVDESGEISPEEFVSGCLRLRGPAKAIDLAAFMYHYKRTATRAKARSQKMNEKINTLLDQSKKPFKVMKRPPLPAVALLPTHSKFSL